MNLFQIVFLDGILLFFPLLIFLVYLSTNKNINNKSKQVYFNLTLVSSFFLTYKYGVNEPIIIPILILNSIVIMFYLKDKYVLANIFSIIILLLYRNNFNQIWILLYIYLIIIILYLVKNKFKICNLLFLEIFIVINSSIYFYWIYKYNNYYFNLYNLLLVILSYLFIVNIIYLTYSTGKRILESCLTFKELQQEKQIRLSLFKITHEIKNPIAVCKGYLDMINTSDKKQVERYVPIIKSEIERLLSLLQDFLLINKNTMHLDIMDLNMLIEDTLDKLEPLLNSNNINLKLNLIDDEVFINGDYNRLSQVLINLIKNSIEAIPNERQGIINISSKLKNNKYYITIEDNGEGMSKEILDKIKEPFYTTKRRGSGLGVALSYEIIEAHSGTIEYESEYGKGTKVKLMFSLYN